MVGSVFGIGDSVVNNGVPVSLLNETSAGGRRAKDFHRQSCHQDRTHLPSLARHFFDLGNDLYRGVPQCWFC